MREKQKNEDGLLPVTFAQEVKPEEQAIVEPVPLSELEELTSNSYTAEEVAFLSGHFVQLTEQVQHLSTAIWKASTSLFEKNSRDRVKESVDALTELIGKIGAV